MLSLSESDNNAPPEALIAWLKREHPMIGDYEKSVLAETYSDLLELRREGRNHIWGFVARNLARPIWLSDDEQRADVVIGNPPWLSYRFMSQQMKKRFKAECQRRGIWEGGKVATHQDLSAYFFARCVELYLNQSGKIAFILPYASLSREQFDGFRAGWFGRDRGKKGQEVMAAVRFTEAWAFDDKVQELFPLPSSVWFARRTSPDTVGPLPATVAAARGTLPRRDATPAEAQSALHWREAPWPPQRTYAELSPYNEAFHNGATIFPRLLFTVEPVRTGMLGGDQSAPIVESRRTNQENEPWNRVSSIRGTVESKFLRPVLLGESIAPYRLLNPVEAVIPWDTASQRLLDAQRAQQLGYVHLDAWLQKAESLWQEHRRSELSLSEQLDYYGKLSAQFPPSEIRVVYVKSGSLPAAVIVEERDAIVENTLYWGRVATRSEALFLVAIFNSETARRRVVDRQSKGQWGARDFHKLMLELPIPRFDAAATLHNELGDAAKHAEEVAGQVPLSEGIYFVKSRRLVREALADDGVATRIDRLVATLLDQGIA